MPPWVHGHIGYAVPEWKRGRGYATRALAALLPLARDVGLSCVELTVSPDNGGSVAVVLKNGGRLVGPFKGPYQSDHVADRYCIDL